MSISGLVVRGYGSFGDIHQLPTLGYSSMPFFRASATLTNRSHALGLTNSAAHSTALTNSAATTLTTSDYQ